MGFIRNKISEFKDNTIWFDKGYSFRFKIANWILRDELRMLLGCIQYDLQNVDRSNATYDENDVRITKDEVMKFYTCRAMRHINDLWKS